jgi:hypothetical protein
MTIKKQNIKIIWILFSLVLLVINFINLKPLLGFLLNGGGDFSGHYVSGKILLTGNAHNFYNFEVQKSLSPLLDKKLCMPNIHTPYEGIFFIPFVMMGYQLGYLTFGIINILFLIISILLILELTKLFGIRDSLFTASLLTVTFLTSFQMSSVLINGQDSIVFLFILTIALVLLYKKKLFKGGIFLGLLVFKPHLAIPFIIAYGTRFGKEVFKGAFISAFICASISFLLIGVDGFQKGLNLFKLIQENPLAYGVNTSSMGNLTGLFHRHFNVNFGLALFLISIIIVIILNTRFKGSLAIDSLNIILILLFSLHSHGHDYVLLFLPIVFLLRTIEKRYMEKEFKTFPDLFLFLSALAFSTPIGSNLYYSNQKNEVIVLLLLTLIGGLYYYSADSTKT